MALEGIQGIYPRCLLIPHEGGIEQHRGYFPVCLLKPWVNLFVARATPIAVLRHKCWYSIPNIRRASFGRTELSERRKVHVRECPILIALSGVAVAPTPEIEEWSGLNGSRRRNDVSPCPFLLVRWEPFARATSV